MMFTKTHLVITLMVAISGKATAQQQSEHDRKVGNAQVTILSPIPSELVASDRMTHSPERDLLLPKIDSLRSNLDTNGEIRYDAAITLAELSLLAYTDQHNRALVLRLMGFEKVVALDDGPMSGFIAIDEEVVVIGFRGTNGLSPTDWLANINLFWQKPMGSGRKFHRGFQDSYARFSELIKLNLSGRKPHFIWLTGHSLGGAMATCCAYDWIINRMALTGLVTFGQPRVANPNMARFLDEQIGDRYLRFRNGDDIAPKVPPTDSLLSPEYRHAGREVWYSRGSFDQSGRLPEANPDDAIDPAAQVDSEPTVQELLELQDYLNRRQTPEQANLIPATLLDSEQRPHGDQHMRSFDSPMSADSILRARTVSSNFRDHSILEYIRLLNQLRP